jgi:hypothetical protein
MFLLLVFLVIPLSVVFVEGLTELVTKSVIFEPLREKLAAKNSFLNKLLQCGYCTSVWVAIFPAVFTAVLLACSFSLWFVLSAFPLVVVYHRMSNYLHNVNDSRWDKFYRKV